MFPGGGTVSPELVSPSWPISTYLVSVPGLLWMRIPLWAIWAVLIAICVGAGIFMFGNMKKIESATE